MHKKNMNMCIIHLHSYMHTMEYEHHRVYTSCTFILDSHIINNRTYKLVNKYLLHTCTKGCKEALYKYTFTPTFRSNLRCSFANDCIFFGYFDFFCSRR